MGGSKDSLHLSGIPTPLPLALQLPVQLKHILSEHQCHQKRQSGGGTDRQNGWTSRHASGFPKHLFYPIAQIMQWQAAA